MNRFTIFALLHDEKTSPTKRAAEIADAMAKVQAELGALRERLGEAVGLLRAGRCRNDSDGRVSHWLAEYDDDAGTLEPARPAVRMELGAGRSVPRP